jgi:hypothetical protein
MRWFYPPTGYKYLVYPHEEQELKEYSGPPELKEYYIYGILMNPGRTQDITTGGYKVDKWSLGICIHTGNNVFMPSMEVENPPIPRYIGYVSQILAVISDKEKDARRRMTAKNNSAQHLEEVMRKKGLHCGSLPQNSPFLPTFAVLRTGMYLEAEQAIRDVDTLTDEFKDSVRYIESLRGDPWDTMEMAFSKGLRDSVRGLVERGLDYDGATEDIPGETDIKMRLERLPHTTDKERTCAWKAAAQGQESASIPPGQLYMPVLIMGEQGERFRLMRVR